LQQGAPNVKKIVVVVAIIEVILGKKAFIKVCRKKQKSFE
jgi:hypothetical protein